MVVVRWYLAEAGERGKEKIKEEKRIQHDDVPCIIISYSYRMHSCVCVCACQLYVDISIHTCSNTLKLDEMRQCENRMKIMLYLKVFFIIFFTLFFFLHRANHLTLTTNHCCLLPIFQCSIEYGWWGLSCIYSLARRCCRDTPAAS